MTSCGYMISVVAKSMPLLLQVGDIIAAVHHHNVVSLDSVQLPDNCGFDDGFEMLFHFSACSSAQ
eukprot:scaffold6863_cov103-Skeletonema_dohrnii-CCMP3373.AAC.5